MSLSVRMISPQLHVVTWVTSRGDDELDGGEAEALAQLVASRRAGANVLLAASAASDGSRLPRAFDGLIEDAPPLDAAIAVGGASEARLALQFHAPRGRGRVVRLPTLAPPQLDALVASLGSRDGIKELERTLDDALAAAASALRTRWSGPDAGHEGKRAVTHAIAGGLEPEALDPADRANARAYAHQADGAIAIARRGVTEDPRIGLLVPRSESFELKPRADGRPLAGFSLVLGRMTAPEDRAVVVRVELDDDELGPWRLGQEGGAGDWSYDTFTIASDLLAGRSRFRLTFTPMSDAPVASFRWTFHAEREIAGSWLFDLDPDAVTLHGVATSADQAIARTFVFESGLGRHQRGLRVNPGARAEYALPSGYTRFTAEPLLWSDAVAKSEATLAVELDGKVATTLKLEPRRWASIELPIAGARRLALAFDATSVEARLALLVPALLR